MGSHAVARGAETELLTQGGGLSDRSRRKRAQIIQAAGTLFLEAGYGATSMDAIAAKAGVSKRTVYAHFANKEALFIAIMDRRCTELSGLDPDAAETPPDGAGRVFQGLDPTELEPTLRHIGSRFLDIVLSEDPMRLFRVVVAEAERFPELGRLYNAFGPEPMVRHLSALLTEAQDAGRMTLDDTPEGCAWRFLNDLKEPRHLMMALGVAPPPTPAEKRGFVDGAVRRLLRSCAPGGPSRQE